MMIYMYMNILRLGSEIKQNYSFKKKRPTEVGRQTKDAIFSAVKYTQN